MALQDSSVPFRCDNRHSSLSSLSTSPSPPTRRPFPLSHGTTTLAFVFQGGVIASADTRASCSGLVSCPSVQKILPIHSHLLVTTSGSGADCMPLERILAREIRLYQLRHGCCLSITSSAKLLSHMLEPFKGTDVCVAAILSGSDVEEVRVDRCGPKLFYVCSDGTRLQGEFFSVGSGSPYAYAVLDGGVRWSLREEAISLAREIVYRATHRDAYSGNCVDLFHITAQGYSHRDREDLREEYHREKGEGAEDGERMNENGERERLGLGRTLSDRL
ncbi:LOW QUALITY PROTEIN: proteasome subunit beta type-11a [Oncorhynchus tshawytscha]|uniref:LOW QUALITY PROTEIN: proteasome subunit beta type-11a n=1 Tax=Oncorhynchus tshawytscha TaxID=74940 RepID=UPI001C3E4AD1|nr:LOW QUALITY PROTEIN: proteasome subunit beta type-11a [Oncorhynchus tshawytscha]